MRGFDVQDALFRDDLARLSSPPAALIDLEPRRFGWDRGSKFAGGFGPTEFLVPDYWTLRARSAQLFETNLYARGLIRRLVTNEINTGLNLEATPEEKLLGREEDSLADWSEQVENRFALWSNDPRLCNQSEQLTFGGLQALARMESLVVGDVLVVMNQDPRTRLPRIHLVNGSSVQTPLGQQPRGGNEIKHGVELDSLGRQVAYHVVQKDGTSKRLPAFGEKSGRRLAWLLYGTEKRLDDVRGKPLLSLVLQSLKEIDRYRDSVQRKATVNAIVAGFIKKAQTGLGTTPFTSGSPKKGTAVVDVGGTERELKVAEHMPGYWLEELAVGEEPVPWNSNGTDEKFGDFEESILGLVAFGHEIPPEIFRLSFSSNYSASQAAINEFKTVLNKTRTAFGEQFCQPVYQEWLIAEALQKKIDAPELLESWRDMSQYDMFGAWVSADWSGAIKPAVDLSKLGKGYEVLRDNGWITNDRAARELTGTKFSKNVQKLARESKALAEAMAPMAALAAAAKPAPPTAPDNEDDTKPKGDPPEDEDAKSSEEGTN